MIVQLSERGSVQWPCRGVEMARPLEADEVNREIDATRKRDIGKQWRDDDCTIGLTWIE